VPGAYDSGSTVSRQVPTYLLRDFALRNYTLWDNALLSRRPEGLIASYLAFLGADTAQKTIRN
jgi:hypothetical protein